MYASVLTTLGQTNGLCIPAYLKVNVLREADLLVKQRGAAHRAQVVALVGQAADHTRRALRERRGVKCH